MLCPSSHKILVPSYGRLKLPSKTVLDKQPWLPRGTTMRTWIYHPPLTFRKLRSSIENWVLQACQYWFSLSADHIHSSEVPSRPQSRARTRSQRPVPHHPDRPRCPHRPTAESQIRRHPRSKCGRSCLWCQRKPMGGCGTAIPNTTTTKSVHAQSGIRCREMEHQILFWRSAYR